MALAATLSDADRVAILRDLLRTADATRKPQSAEALRREEEGRYQLEELPARRRYIAFAERLT